MKRKIFITLCAALLVVVLTVAFAGCLKISMKKNSVIQRLSDQGYTIKYSSYSEEIDGYQKNGVHIDDIVFATKDENAVDEEGKPAISFVRMFYCTDTDSADWVEEMVKKFRDDNKYELVTNKRIEIYRYENIIFVGDFESVAIARNY